MRLALATEKTKVKLASLAVLTASLCLASCSNDSYQYSGQEDTTAKPKNIILMVSDGIGFNGWLAADYYQGLAGTQSYQIERPDGTKPIVLGLAHNALNLIDKDGNILSRGADNELAVGAIDQGYDPNTRWDKFENAMLNDFLPGKTSYTSYTDSAAAGTALLSGRKTSVGRINIDWTGDIPFTTIAELAAKNDLSTGAVSSVMLSHATPAAVTAHNVSRNNYEDIFNEMMASDLDVIMGGGHPLYDSSGQFVANKDDRKYKYVGGEESFAAITSGTQNKGFSYIDSLEDFTRLAAGENIPERVLGLARTVSTLQAAREDLAGAETPSGMAYNTEVPNLPTMSLGALNVLNQNPNGFFVMIEGGAVDWMGHSNDMPRFIEEQIDFNKAVDAVINWVETHSSWDETLLVITSDHECGGIWGEGTWTNSSGGSVAKSREKSSIVNARFNPEEDTFNNYLAVQDKGEGEIPGYQWASGNHTNELVPLWAIGKGSERFLEFTRSDLKAAELWGSNYGWNGQFVDNTAVFHVMSAGLNTAP